MKNIVGHAEGISEGRVFVADPEQVLVRNHDQRVDKVLQFLDAFLGQGGPVASFELERLGHNANSQDALFARCAGDDRCGPGTRATAHTGGDEGHVAALQVIDDLIERLFGSGASDVRACAGTQTIGDIGTQLNATFGRVHRQRLGIRVGNNEFDAFEVRGDHVVDRVRTGTANTHHDDTRLQLGLRGGSCEVKRHVILQ